MTKFRPNSVPEADAKLLGRRVLIVGHRGAGKTSFLKRIQLYCPTAHCFDLDREIERREGLSVSEIFESKGEAAFRALEISCLAEIEARVSHETSSDVFVAAGGGFSGETPNSWSCWWLRRKTDADGRIFLDRPRLDPQTSALNEYRVRFEQREPRFARMADRVWTLSEGFDFANEIERAWVCDEISGISGEFCFSKREAELYRRRPAELHRRLKMSYRTYELRDDLLEADDFAHLAAEIPPDKLLLSFRDLRRFEQSLAVLKKFQPHHVDWALELGDCPEGLVKHVAGNPEIQLIFSLHQPALVQTAHGSASLLKYSPEIETFSELIFGHRWWQEDSQRRVFLPRSNRGQWDWYRRLIGASSRLNFVSDGLVDGSSRDQPILFDYLRSEKLLTRGRQGFLAVLGDPVRHSLTPAEHYAFASARNEDTMAIRISRDEDFALAVEFLAELGLKHAAVTSPLKKPAAEFVCRQSLRHQAPHHIESDVINTLLKQGGSWIAENTDVIGLSRAWAEMKNSLQPTLSSEVVVWGAGALLESLQRVIPHARLFSARTGAPREASDGKMTETLNPEVLIWGIGRAQFEELGSRWPENAWHPKIIFDLGYGDDSPAKEYALKLGAKYFSGHIFFRQQAQAQREFWSKFEELESDSGLS